MAQRLSCRSPASQIGEAGFNFHLLGPAWPPHRGGIVDWEAEE